MPSEILRCERKMIGLLLNVLLRLSIAYFLVEVLLNPDDPRFVGKALPVRNLIIVGGLSLLFPALQLVWRRWESYPFWVDDLFLSIFWLDMVGNSFNLYDSLPHFDLLPHFHGTGAVAIVLRVATRLPALSAVGLANMSICCSRRRSTTPMSSSARTTSGVWRTW